MSFTRNLSASPNDNFYIRVCVDAMGEDSGDKLRIAGPVWADDFYLFAELTLGDECGTLQLFRNDGGVITELSVTSAVLDAIPDVYHHLCICYKDDYYSPMIIASVETASGVTRWISAHVDVTAETPDTDGVTGGIGAEVTTNAHFDNYRINETRTDLTANCPPCEVPCLVGEDDFNRSDDTNIGCEWQEYSGNWEIDTNQLQAISSGRVRYLVSHGTPDDLNAKVTAYLSGGPGDSARIIIETDPLDPLEFIFGEVTFGFIGTGYIRIGTSSGGVDTIIVEEAGSFTSDDFALCVTDSLISFVRDGTGLGVSTATGIPTAVYYPGLAADFSYYGQMRFDNFSIAIIENASFPECAPCHEFFCFECEDDQMPSSWILTLGGNFQDHFGNCNPALHPTCDEWDGLSLPIESPGGVIYGRDPDCCRHSVYVGTLDPSYPFTDMHGPCGNRFAADVCVERVNTVPPQYAITVYIQTASSAGSTIYTFRKIYSTRPDCDMIVGLDVPYQSSGSSAGGPVAWCDWIGPSVTLDAVV